MTNDLFLKALSRSFRAFIESGTSRSTAKLKPLHGAVAHDIASRLGTDFKIVAQGYQSDREETIAGRYMDKAVDIAIVRDNRSVAGIGVKFVMQNYSQNSNNYFESMLGETANIRCNNCPYFQIFIVLDRLPYYKKNNAISRWESFTDHNADKYLALRVTTQASTITHPTKH